MRYMPRVVVNLSYVAKLVICLCYRSRRSHGRWVKAVELLETLDCSNYLSK